MGECYVNREGSLLKKEINRQDIEMEWKVGKNYRTVYDISYHDAFYP